MLAQKSLTFPEPSSSPLCWLLSQLCQRCVQQNEPQSTTYIRDKRWKPSWPSVFASPTGVLVHPLKKKKKNCLAKLRVPCCCIPLYNTKIEIILSISHTSLEHCSAPGSVLVLLPLDHYQALSSISFSMSVRVIQCSRNSARCPVLLLRQVSIL